MTYCAKCRIWFDSVWCYSCGCTKHDVDEETKKECKRAYRRALIAISAKERIKYAEGNERRLKIVG